MSYDDPHHPQEPDTVQRSYGVRASVRFEYVLHVRIDGEAHKSLPDNALRSEVRVRRLFLTRLALRLCLVLQF